MSTYDPQCAKCGRPAHFGTCAQVTKMPRRKEPTPDQTPSAINRRKRLEAIVDICAPAKLGKELVFVALGPSDVEEIYRLAKRNLMPKKAQTKAKKRSTKQILETAFGALVKPGVEWHSPSPPPEL